MKTRIVQAVTVSLIAASVILLSSCDSDNDPVDPGPPEEPSAWVGSAACETCHDTAYAQHLGSGHAEHFQRVADDQAPRYIHASRMEHPVVAPPPGHSWESIAIVLGGTGSYALFVGTDGQVVTGESARWDLGTGEWTSYLPGQQQTFECGTCHTTGLDPEIDGIVNGWQLDGVACEACHGPGREHVESGFIEDIVIVATTEFCDQCHANGHGPVGSPAVHGLGLGTRAVPAGHLGVGCLECHNPHASVRFDREQAIRKECIDCHSAN
jgi:hypothetical protein